jgi:hypothetical protein
MGFVTNPMSVFDIIITIIDFSDVVARKFREGREYRAQRFGRVRGELYYWLGLLDTTTVQRYHLNINLWTKQEALDWRESFKARCEAVSVAAAIFASVGLTALQLGDMSSTHWSASALVTASMALGVFSVTAATNLQNSVASLSNHREIRLWLSKGLALYGREQKYPEVYQQLPLQSSVATVKLVAAPTLFLNLAVLTYFLGFGLYLLYGWLWAVAPPASNFRNIFIFYTVTIGAVVGYVALFWGKRILDQDKVNQQFNLNRFFDTNQVGMQNDLLEKWSDVVETLMEARTEKEKDSARREMETVLRKMRDTSYGNDNDAGPGETQRDRSEELEKASEQA